MPRCDAAAVLRGAAGQQGRWLACAQRCTCVPYAERPARVPPQGLYSGFGATLMRDIPEIAIQFALYEHLKAAALGYWASTSDLKVRCCAPGWWWWAGACVLHGVPRCTAVRPTAKTSARSMCVQPALGSSRG